VAVTLIKSGDGVEDGATYSPDESMDPHDPGTPHPAPAMVHVTCWLSVPAIVAAKRCCPLLDSEALPGNTLTTMCGRIVTLAEDVWLVSAWLVAVSLTGLGDGTPAGAR
jgi:hypothetical protein